MRQALLGCHPNLPMPREAYDQNPVANGPTKEPMESHESGPIAAPLANRVGRDANAAQIADAMVSTWQEIDAALTPIVGGRGVVALYKRSLYLTADAHPWLAGMHDGPAATIDLAALKSIVAQQSSADAALGGNALFQNFHQLLASLVGSSLTERLLRPAWADSSGVPPAQDNKP